MFMNFCLNGLGGEFASCEDGKGLYLRNSGNVGIREDQRNLESRKTFQTGTAFEAGGGRCSSRGAARRAGAD